MADDLTVRVECASHALAVIEMAQVGIRRRLWSGRNGTTADALLEVARWIKQREEEVEQIKSGAASLLTQAAQLVGERNEVERRTYRSGERSEQR